MSLALFLIAFVTYLAIGMAIANLSLYQNLIQDDSPEVRRFLFYVAVTTWPIMIVWDATMSILDWIDERRS